MKRLLIGAALCGLLAGSPVFAEENPLDPILACSQIADPVQRLECFDRQTEILSGSVTRGEVVAVDRQAMEAVERDTFGLSLPSLPRLSLSLFSGGADASAHPEEAAPRQRGISNAESSGGAQVVERRSDGQIDRVMMTISEVGTVGYNTRRFTMTNGQIWDQTDTDRVNVPRARGGEPLQAEIRRAGAGGFFLRINGQGRAIRVERVR